MKTLKAIVCLCVLAALPSGCMTVGPDFKKPEMDLPAKWREANTTHPSGKIEPGPSVTKWWTLFNDPSPEPSY